MGLSIYSSARAFGAAGAAKQPQPAAAEPAEPQTRQVQGRLFEVLPGYGLAHFEADDGFVYGMTRTTPGIVFAELRAGQLVRCTVAVPQARVLAAAVVA